MSTPAITCMSIGPMFRLISPKLETCSRIRSTQLQVSVQLQGFRIPIECLRASMFRIGIVAKRDAVLSR